MNSEYDANRYMADKHVAAQLRVLGRVEMSRRNRKRGLAVRVVLSWAGVAIALAVIYNVVKEIAL